MNTANKQSFIKPFLTIEQQINQLKSRGMNFHDEEKAKYYLENLNYYRLGGYWLHHLTIVRNTSAHHSRVWNKRFAIDFSLLNFPKELNERFNPARKKYIYNTLVMCEYLMSIISGDSSWRKRLDDLILKHDIDIKRMGFKVKSH